ncbi:MAG: pseudouridine synthase, partial [Candidatus Eisenbacteria bacterium]|nr:pseudouridine synthase [Candidatus Eisenbacteria bacterium]
MDGIVAVAKPPGPTSHDVVRAVRRLCPGTKVGHAGTLDPSASGVVVICLGTYTRLASLFLDTEK